MPAPALSGWYEACGASGMKLTTTWNQKMRLTAEAGGLTTSMDAKAPIGESSALTPKEHLLAAACECKAMDVLALLRKYRQPLDAFAVEADAKVSEGTHPTVFESLLLTFRLRGAIDRDRALEAMRLSQTRF